MPSCALRVIKILLHGGHRGHTEHHSGVFKLKHAAKVENNETVNKNLPFTAHRYGRIAAHKLRRGNATSHHR